jgi:hypothetical protein
MRTPYESSRIDKRNGPKSYAAILLALLVFLTAFRIEAQDAGPDPDAVPIAQGEPAPFSGILIPYERAIRLGQRAERCDAEKALDAARLTRRHAIEIELCEEKARIDAEALGLEAERWETEAERLAAWYRDPAVVAGAAVITTYAATVGALWVLNQATRGR